MGLLDNYTGVGMSPRPKFKHQRTMAYALRFMYDEMEAQNMTIYSETTVTDDYNDLALDLIAFDADFVPQMIIEITTHRELKQIIKKCYELIARFPDAEYFVYDYEQKMLYMYDAENDLWLSSADCELYSVYLRNPIIDYLTTN